MPLPTPDWTNTSEPCTHSPPETSPAADTVVHASALTGERISRLPAAPLLVTSTVA